MAERTRPSRSFVAVWIGTAAGTLADTVSEVAIPLLVIAAFTDSPLVIGAVLAAEQAGWLLIGLFAGVWVDRARRKRTVLVSALVIRAVTWASLPIAWMVGWLTLVQLLMCSAIVGLTAVFASIAEQTVIPAVVERVHLVRANAAISGTRSAISVAGQGVGGLLVQAVGAPFAVLLDAFLALGAALSFRLVKEQPARDAPSSDTVPAHWWRELREGLRAVRTDSKILSLLAVGAVSNFVVAAQAALLLVFLVSTLEVEPVLAGLALGAAGLGGLVGAALLPAATKRWGSGVVWRGALLLSAIFGLLVPLAAGPAAIWIFVGGSAAQSTLLTMSMILTMTARQLVTPPQLLGRVTSVSMFATWGLIPVGLLLGGWLGEVLGVREALLGLAVSALLPWLVAVFGPLRRERSLADDQDSNMVENQ